MLVQYVRSKTEKEKSSENDSKILMQLVEVASTLKNSNVRQMNERKPIQEPDGRTQYSVKTVRLSEIYKKMKMKVLIIQGTVAEYRKPVLIIIFKLTNN